MNLFDVGGSKPKKHSGGAGVHGFKHVNNITNNAMPVQGYGQRPSLYHTQDQVYPLRKFSATKPNITLKLYNSDLQQTNYEQEMSKIASLFERLKNWRKIKSGAMKRRSSFGSGGGGDTVIDIVDNLDNLDLDYRDGENGEDDDEEDEESSGGGGGGFFGGDDDDEDATEEDSSVTKEVRMKAEEKREAVVVTNHDGVSRAPSALYKRVNLSWSWWTFDSPSRLSITSLSKPLYRQRTHHMDLFFRMPTNKNHFEDGKMECCIRINSDSIQMQARDKILFSNEAHNILPLSIEVVHEKSNLPGLWDKVLITKGSNHFSPSVKCILSGDMNTLANNPVTKGEFHGDSISTPVIYELHSMYTSNPDVSRLLNVNLEAIRAGVDLTLATNQQRKYEMRYQPPETDLNLLVFMYLDEIIGCIDNEADRLPSSIFDTQNNQNTGTETTLIRIPMKAISVWLSKKIAVIEKERKLMDARDIQLIVKPASQSDAQLVKQKIEKKQFDPTDAEYMCHIRLHYIPLKSPEHSMQLATSTTSLSAPSSSPSSSSSSVASIGLLPHPSTNILTPSHSSMHSSSFSSTSPHSMPVTPLHNNRVFTSFFPMSSK